MGQSIDQGAVEQLRGLLRRQVQHDLQGRQEVEDPVLCEPPATLQDARRFHQGLQGHGRLTFEVGHGMQTDKRRSSIEQASGRRRLWAVDPGVENLRHSVGKRQIGKSLRDFIAAAETMKQARGHPPRCARGSVAARLR